MLIWPGLSIIDFYYFNTFLHIDNRFLCHIPIIIPSSDSCICTGSVWGLWVAGRREGEQEGRVEHDNDTPY